MLNAETLRRKLEVSTTIAVLSVSAIVLLTSLRTYFHRDRSLQTAPGLRKGEVLSQLENYHVSKSAKTLIIALNTACAFCVEGTPFYNQLAEVSHKNQTQVISIFSNSVDDVRRFTQEHQLKTDSIAEADLNELKISATPALILVDSKGRVLDFWIGKLSEDDQQKVMKSIASFPSSAIPNQSS